MTTIDAPGARFCRDCRWLDVQSWMRGPEDAHCVAPQNFGIEHTNPVTGETERSPFAIHCANHRNNDLPGRCGTTGRWFEDRAEALMNEAAE